MLPELAARSVGVSTRKFNEMVVVGRMPRPKKIYVRVVWDRMVLDMAFNDLLDQEVDTRSSLQKLIDIHPVNPVEQESKESRFGKACANSLSATGGDFSARTNLMSLL